MRNLLIALLVVGFLAAPSFGVVNIKLVPDSATLAPGQSTVVRLLAQGTNAGVYSMGGYITAAGLADALTSTGQMTFTSSFQPTGLFTPKSVPGTTNFAKGGFGDLTPLHQRFRLSADQLGRPEFRSGQGGLHRGLLLHRHGGRCGRTDRRHPVVQHQVRQRLQAARSGQDGRAGPADPGRDHRYPRADDDGPAGPRRSVRGSPSQLETYRRRPDAQAATKK